MRLWRFFFSALLLSSIFAVVSSAKAVTPGSFRVLQFSPQGTVKGVRQVSVRFSEPIVPLGGPRASIEPFEINCPEAGSARWVDSQN
jgi:hypothetical protein